MVSPDRHQRLDPEPAAHGLAEVPPIDRRLDDSADPSRQDRVADADLAMEPISGSILRVLASTETYSTATRTWPSTSWSSGSVSSAKQSSVASPVGRRTRVTRVLVGGIREHSVPGCRVRGLEFGVRVRRVRRVIVVGVSAPRIDLGCSATGLG